MRITPNMKVAPPAIRYFGSAFFMIVPKLDFLPNVAFKTPDGQA
jgi:hypothetical protein